MPLALPAQETAGATRDDAPLPLLAQAFAKVQAEPRTLAALPVRPQGLVAPLPMLAGAAPVLGHVTADRGVDGALRYDLPLLPWRDEWFPSLALRLAGAAMGERDWGRAEAVLGDAVRWGRLNVPLDGSSRQWINYLGPAGSFPSFSFIDVLEGRVPAERLRGTVVIVGATALGSGDTFPTPFDSGLPGVERLATVVDNLITSRTLRRGPALVEIAAMLLPPLSACWLLARLPARQAATALLLLLLAGLLLAQALFQLRLQFYSLAFALIALALAVFGAALLRAHRERERKEAAVQALRISEERYALAARGASDGLWDWDRGSGALHLSDRWWALMGLAPRVAVGIEAFTLALEPAGRAAFETALQEHLDGRSQQLHHLLQFRQGGQERALLVRGMASRDATGQALRLAGSLTDLSETQSLQRQLSHDALHDRLTGLANRALFLEHLQQLVAEPVGVVLVGIDGFRAFNETEGSQLGDALLRELGRRLAQRATASTVLRPTVARLGADLFGLIFVAPLEPGGQDAARTPAILLALASDPMQVSGRELRVGVTLGWAHRSHGLDSADELLAAAEMALALAKGGAQRGGCRAYDPADQLLQNSRRWLRDNLDAALRAGDQLQMHYQPLVSLADRRLLGFEALIRWQHPERGFIMPGDFIPFAEQSGQIVALGAWTLRQVAEQLSRWHAMGFEGEIAVNLSSRQFVEGDLQADARAALALLADGVSPRRLKLEVTESMAMANPHETAAQLQALHALGFKISIDDFGTGYSSLAYLHQFPFDTLKI
ncbi:MAG: EAL domain-containing protein, partial [Inhella sp.]